MMRRRAFVPKLFDARGVSVLEVLMASAIAIVVILGLGVMDANRGRQQNEMSTRTRTLQDQTGVSLAMLHIAQTIERADRLNIPATLDKLQARRLICPAASCPSGCQTEPLAPSCFDASTNYQWVEYRRLSDGTLQFLTNQGGGVCGTPLILSDRITALKFQYVAPAAGESAPPGGDPFGGSNQRQNNMVNYSLTWNNGTSQHAFEAHAVSRTIAYSNVSTQQGTGTTGYGDSGVGVGPAGSPPSFCP